MASVLTLTNLSGPSLGAGTGSTSLTLASGVSGLASISDTTAAGTLTAVTDGDYLLGLNSAGTFVRKVLKSSIITTDASLLTSGTLADARLSSNVPLKDAANVFTAAQTVAGTLKVRQSGGTPGTDEVQVYHDGSNGYIVPNDGQLCLGTVFHQTDGYRSFYMNSVGGIKLSASGGLLTWGPALCGGRAIL